MTFFVALSLADRTRFSKARMQFSLFLLDLSSKLSRSLTSSINFSSIKITSKGFMKMVPSNKPKVINPEEISAIFQRTNDCLNFNSNISNRVLGDIGSVMSSQAQHVLNELTGTVLTKLSMSFLPQLLEAN